MRLLLTTSLPVIGLYPGKEEETKRPEEFRFSKAGFLSEIDLKMRLFCHERIRS